MPDNTVFNSQQSEDRFQTLLNNANAARVISQAVEGTIGPRGLDIMMIDKFGDVIVSNDGVTILRLMEVNHPAARMMINTAKAQQEAVGDGTTTATIIAGTLLAEGAGQVMKGIPVTRLLQGIKTGIDASLDLLEKKSQKIGSLDDELLYKTALIAGREHEDLAGHIIEGARLLGKEKMLSNDFHFADTIIAREASRNQVFRGVVLNKETVNKQMPVCVEDALILVIDDALAPEEIAHEAMKTESGFQYYLDSRNKYEENLKKICSLGINMVVVDRGIDDTAEEIFTRAGIMVLQRVSSREIDCLCRHTGAKKIKRSTLNAEADMLKTYLGRARKAVLDEKQQDISVLDGEGENWATIIVAASTGELLDERERMARDAASAVQAAVAGGIVPGGGAVEVWLATQLEDMARDLEGLSSFGVLCVKEALLKPFACIVNNSGFNALEKLGDVIAAQRKHDSASIGLNCETGDIIDVVQKGIVDPTLVKSHAILAAGEVALAILRISSVIKMRNEGEKSDSSLISYE